MQQKALLLLRQALNNSTANFRSGQWEAIEELVIRRSRLLVVQRTGWGKSLVYFLATRLLIDQGAGCSLLISPLLALMRNQIAAAQRIGVKAATINSSNQDDWELVKTQLLAGQVDILLISPERLANEEFRENILSPISQRIGLFVVDEAHCISDWGHDFRPDYRRIVRILQALPSNIPVLATTATANNRVVDDITNQLGANLCVVRGNLTRESLRLQNIYLPNPAQRMAWLAENLPNLPGSGIIYTLTVRDADRVANWLQTQGINAKAYHSELENDIREVLEDELLNNQIKALVATTALGMGFDKPDLGFVIHYQRPGSIVHYYQQVGRAGRAVETGLAIVGSRDVDEETLSYTQRVAQNSALAGMQVISGGARGVDQEAMLTVLNAGGTSVGVLADSLTKAAVNSKYRSSIKDGKLTLISSYDPDAGFNTGNAMGRNKYIYALADYALVVNSSFGSGGTWAGAVEALSKIREIPVFVRMSPSISEGNQQLFNQGAKPFPPEPWNNSLKELLSSTTLITEAVKDEESKTPPETSLDIHNPKNIYEAVLPFIISNLQQPKDAKSLAQCLEVQPSQMQEWLKRAVQEGKVRKINKPVAYISNQSATQLSLVL